MKSVVISEQWLSYDGWSRQRGIRVTQARIRNSMHRVDPEGVVLHWREAIQRSIEFQVP